MSAFRDLPPTAGLPVFAGELLSAFRNRHTGDLLAQDFQKSLGAPFTAITCSGTAALYIICETIKELSPRRTILIPAFICPLVALAIRRAGFSVALYDIGPIDFSADIGKISAACAAHSDIAAVLVNHLGGIPVDISPLKKALQGSATYVIEDCAQSFGAISTGRAVGTLGDFSFFSLAAGKGLTLYEGGVLVVNTAALGGPTEATMLRLARPDMVIETRRILEMGGYALFYRPALFWFVFTLPQLFWNMRDDTVKALREGFDITFPVHSVSGFRKAAGHAAFPRIAAALQNQRKKAARYINALKDLSGITIIRESTADTATYPYLAVVFDDPARQKTSLRLFSNTGLGVSQIYARALPDYDYLRGFVPEENCENARRLAATTITLSTSTFVNENDIEKCLYIMRSVCSI